MQQKYNIQQNARINFTELTTTFIREILNLKIEEKTFFQYLFICSLDMQKNDIHFIFVGTREVRKTRKKFRKKDSKLIDYISINIHYFLSIIYSQVHEDNKDLFEKYFYDNNGEIKLNNFTILMVLINQEKDIFLFNRSETSFITDAIYNVNDNKFQTQQILINLEKVNQKFHPNLKEKFPTSNILAYMNRVEACKENRYILMKQNFFLAMTNPELDIQNAQDELQEKLRLEILYKSEKYLI